MYALGRSQGILRFETAAQIVLLVGVLLLFRGVSAVRLASASIALLCFTVPLPGELVSWVTGPLKSAVSAVAVSVLHSAGYPVARTGVILSVGQYQLLVADACAGLSSIFTLEALGLIYMKLTGKSSTWRNLTLAALLIPIAFLANVVRVLILILVTYHFGDEVGQGFVHGFAGLVLFCVATLLMITVDGLLDVVPRWARKARGAV